MTDKSDKPQLLPAIALIFALPAVFLAGTIVGQHAGDTICDYFLRMMGTHEWRVTPWERARLPKTSRPHGPAHLPLYWQRTVTASAE